MPNDGQLADSRTLLRFQRDPRLQEVLRELERRTAQDLVPPSIASIKSSNWLPENVLAVDGSLHELPLTDGFPGSQICYYSIAGVLIKLANLQGLDRERPIAPEKFRQEESAEAMTAVLTGANVVQQGTTDPRATFRHYLFEALEKNAVLEKGETLLQTFEHLLSLRPKSSKVQTCPIGPACQDPAKAYRPASGTYSCSCANKAQLFSTDALDIHNSMNEAGLNGRLFGEALQAIEGLWFFNLIRWVVIYSGLDVKALEGIAFVMDGPLRIDGEPAWLSQAMKAELLRLNADVKSRGGKDLLIVGVEKTGNFVEHFKLLDRETTGSPNKLDPQTLFLLTNDYIRKHIAPGDRTYGDVTYYGRKIFYKTKTKALICATVPYLNAGDDDLTKADPDQFARLPDILSILDQLASSRYPDAILPVLAAHTEAAIPLSQGRRVLEMLTREQNAGLIP